MGGRGVHGEADCDGVGQWGVVRSGVATIFHEHASKAQFFAPTLGNPLGSRTDQESCPFDCR